MVSPLPPASVLSSEFYLQLFSVRDFLYDDHPLNDRVTTLEKAIDSISKALKEGQGSGYAKELRALRDYLSTSTLFLSANQSPPKVIGDEVEQTLLKIRTYIEANRLEITAPRELPPPLVVSSVLHAESGSLPLDFLVDRLRHFPAITEEQWKETHQADREAEAFLKEILNELESQRWVSTYHLLQKDEYLEEIVSKREVLKLLLESYPAYASKIIELKGRSFLVEILKENSWAPKFLPEDFLKRGGVSVHSSPEITVTLQLREDLLPKKT